jgi:WhiB family redox-sensing transcriptional regulator
MGEWADEANCRTLDAEIFFPEDERGMPSNKQEDYELASTICRRCNVRAHCTAFALETDQRWGMWGGLLPNRRAKIRRNAARNRVSKWTVELAQKESDRWIRLSS